MADWHAKGSLRYPEYLKVRELISLQEPRSRPPHHDETLFIIVHQVFELWFKLMLHDLDAACLGLERDDPRAPLKLVRRAATTLARIVDQIDVLEGMSALDFLEFRAELEGASGFQSAQFRELEALLGIRPQDRVPVVLEGAHGDLDAYRGLLQPEERARLEQRQAGASVEEAFLGLVRRRVRSPTEGRAYLEDIAEALSELEPPRARALLPALEAIASVASGDELETELRRLRALPLWGALDAGDRTVVADAAAHGRLADAVRKTGRLGGDDTQAQAFEVRLIEEDLRRRLTVPLERVAADLAAAGIDPERRADVLALLDTRQRLRQVYRRGAHRAGAAGDTYELFLLAETLVDLAETFHVFRVRHVKMVERMIGRRRGTGGSPGVAYLEQTVRYRVFPELMRVRTFL